MKYDWVSEQILNRTHAEAVDAIVAQGKEEIIEALREAGWPMLPCGHHPDYADDRDGKAVCLACDAEVRHIVLTRQMRTMRRALKNIAKHGSGLSRFAAELTLKELRNAK